MSGGLVDVGRGWPPFNLLGIASSASATGDAAFGLGAGGDVDKRRLGGGSPRYLVDGFLRSDIWLLHMGPVYSAITFTIHILFN